MAERALRGTRLGATSYENDRNTDLAPRQEIAFDCPKGHHFTVPFAAEAEVPATWECRICGAVSFTSAGRSEEHTSELQSQSNLVCRLLLEKKKKKKNTLDVVTTINLR